MKSFIFPTLTLVCGFVFGVVALMSHSETVIGVFETLQRECDICAPLIEVPHFNKAVDPTLEPSS